MTKQGAPEDYQLVRNGGEKIIFCLTLSVIPSTQHELPRSVSVENGFRTGCLAR
jgi:hypothetical protein